MEGHRDNIFLGLFDILIFTGWTLARGRIEAFSSFEALATI